MSILTKELPVTCVWCGEREATMRNDLCVQCWKADFERREQRALYSRRWPIWIMRAAWIIFAMIMLVMILRLEQII